MCGFFCTTLARVTALIILTNINLAYRRKSPGLQNQLLLPVVYSLKNDGSSHGQINLTKFHCQIYLVDHPS